MRIFHYPYDIFAGVQDVVPFGAVSVVGRRIPGSHILNVKFDHDGLRFARFQRVRLCESDQRHRRFFQTALHIRRGDVNLNGLFARDVARIGHFHGNIEFIHLRFTALRGIKPGSGNRFSERRFTGLVRKQSFGVETESRIREPVAVLIGDAVIPPGVSLLDGAFCILLGDFRERTADISKISFGYFRVYRFVILVSEVNSLLVIHAVVAFAAFVGGGSSRGARLLAVGVQIGGRSCRAVVSRGLIIVAEVVPSGIRGEIRHPFVDKSARGGNFADQDIRKPVESAHARTADMYDRVDFIVVL